jgi:AcrR family transcriptional regulator
MQYVLYSMLGMVSSKTTKPKPAGLGERRARTQARLIKAAREAIGEKGFHRASLDEIAARAGLTKGAIYDNFASKDELFLAAVSTWTTERNQRFAWPQSLTGTLKARLRRLAEALIADVPEARLEAPMRAEFLLYTLTHEEMRERVAETGPLHIAQMRAQLLKFIKEDELSLPLDKFVVLLQALVPGLMFMRSQAPDMVSDETIIAIFESFASHA